MILKKFIDLGDDSVAVFTRPQSEIYTGENQGGLTIISYAGDKPKRIDIPSEAMPNLIQALGDV